MNKRLIIQNGKVIFPDKIVDNLTVVIENGTIADILEKGAFIPATNMSRPVLSISTPMAGVAMISWMAR